MGLLGYHAGQRPDPLWRGRNDARNAGFADLLFSSGLRLREGGCMLTLEVPDAAGGHRYCEGSVAAVAKRRERMLHASAAAVQRVAAYGATTRAEAIRRAHRGGAYDRVVGKLIITKIGGRGGRRKLSWRDEQGRVGEALVRAIGPAERMRLFAETERGLEPLLAVADRGRRPDGV